MFSHVCYFSCPIEGLSMSFAHVSQMIFNTCFALSDCDGELPESFGFVLLDFKALRRGGRDVQRHLAFGTHFFFGFWWAAWVCVFFWSRVNCCWFMMFIQIWTALKKDQVCGPMSYTHEPWACHQFGGWETWFYTPTATAVFWPQMALVQHVNSWYWQKYGRYKIVVVDPDLNPPTIYNLQRVYRMRAIFFRWDCSHFARNHSESCSYALLFYLRMAPTFLYSRYLEPPFFKLLLYEMREYFMVHIYI